MFVGVVSSRDFSESDSHVPVSCTWIQSKFTVGISQPIIWSSSLLSLAGGGWRWCDGDGGTCLGEGGGD